jgi:hypothetical protein
MTHKPLEETMGIDGSQWNTHKLKRTRLDWRMTLCKITLWYAIDASICYENDILKEGSTQNFHCYDITTNPHLKSMTAYVFLLEVMVVGMPSVCSMLLYNQWSTSTFYSHSGSFSQAHTPAHQDLKHKKWVTFKL